MSKTFVIADIHGGFRALKQCFERSGFDYRADTLICLGDTVDGWCQSKQCIDELLKIKNLIHCSGNHDCLSMDTEILTLKGWKFFKELTDSDKVYSLDIKRNIGTWSSINEKIIKPYKGDMYHFKNQHVDMLVTPTHRILCKKRSGSIYKDFEYIHAKNLNGRARIPLSSISNIIDYDISDDMLKIVAWILTDGCISRSTENQVGSYVIYQSKGLDEIASIADREGLKYKKSERIRNVKPIKGRVVKNTLSEKSIRFYRDSAVKIRKYLNHKSEFPKWIFNLSKRQFDLFIKVVKQADGSVPKHTDNSFCLYGIESFLEKIQILCHINGCRAVLKINKRGEPLLNISFKGTTEFEVIRVVNNLKYDDYVWCLNVPLSNFMVRRNGKVFFTGNCWFLDWIEKHEEAEIDLWTSQGGEMTIHSYGGSYKNVPDNHYKLLKDAPIYYIDSKDRLFVHGGFIPDQKLKETDPWVLMWDRSLFKKAYKKSISDPDYVFSDFTEIYIGHTSTYFYDSKVPLNFCNLWAIDTGGGYEGRLTIMDIDTHEFWQSDKVMDLYTLKDDKKDAITFFEYYMKNGGDDLHIWS